MNGDNVGRVEGENRDLGSDREGFRNDLDIDKNPDTEDYAQEYDESGEQMEVNSPEESETGSSKEDGGLEERREKRKKTYRRVVNGVVLGSMLSQAGGSTATMANAQKEREKKEDNVTPVREQYHEDVTKESTEDKQEFKFLDPSIGSGLDSEGFAKESVVVETEERDVVQEIKDIIDITKWEGYKLESAEEIEPTYYVPNSEIYKEDLEVPLYVIPLHEDGLVNEDHPVLKYSLVPAKFNSFEVGLLYDVITPQGDILTFGSPKKIQESRFNGNFVVLMSVHPVDGEVFDFMSKNQDPSVSEEINKGFLSGNGKGDLDPSLWENILTARSEVFPTDFVTLSNNFDPSFYCIGSRYDSSNVSDFIEVFDSGSVLNKFSSEYIKQNRVLEELLNLSEEIDNLDLNPSSVCSLEESREGRFETDPRFLIINLNRRYPGLNLPIASFGVYDEGAVEKVYLGDREEEVRTSSLNYTFYKEIIEIFKDNSFEGNVVVDIPARRMLDPQSFLLYEGDFYSSSGEENSRVEVRVGEFELEDFKIGDIVLMENTEDSDVSYLVVVGKEQSNLGETFLAGVQANRYGQRRLSVLGVDKENIEKILSERVLIIRKVE
jgi:hypothetical protein